LLSLELGVLLDLVRLEVLVGHISSVDLVLCRFIDLCDLPIQIKLQLAHHRLLSSDLLLKSAALQFGILQLVLGLLHLTDCLLHSLLHDLGLVKGVLHPFLIDIFQLSQ
jgi:hypothetical protein